MRSSSIVRLRPREVEISPGRYEYIGIDFRSDPIDSEVDRVCCECGESLCADGKCDYCETQDEY